MSRAVSAVFGPAALVPGRPYAERAEPDPAWHDQAVDYVLLAGRCLWRRTTASAGIVTWAECHDASLRSLGDAELASRVPKLRLRLRSEGLGIRLVGECFALIRECSGRVLGLRHYDTQMMAGWALLQGRLVEMATGEGKTMAATLAAAVVAMAGLPVHVVTVNDYLAERDAEATRPLFRMLGLTTAAVVQGMEPSQRQAAYASSVTYCSNKELAFDYLRDRLAISRRGSRLHLALDRLSADTAPRPELALRGLHFAIVDEADSVFVDEARTPLILSATVETGDEAVIYRHALAIAASLRPSVHFVLGLASNEVALTHAGEAILAELAADPDTPGRASVWSFARAREALIGQALRALHLLRRDHDYVVTDGAVQIVDVSTGRVMEGRAWEAGLHQLVELKEGCALTGRRETLARITYQRLFRRFVRLSGMTGTAREVAPEIRAIYGLDVVRVRLHRPSRRRRGVVQVHATAAQKWQAVADRVEAMAIGAGRPVLVGTSSVASSELVATLLAARGIAHALLNAKQDREEALIVARAGQAGCVTVATNMAGRGTDILLGEGVAERGGLHVILTEFHDSPRVDRQLFGRCARQGDPGSFDIIVSWEDEVYAVHAPRLASWARKAGIGAPFALAAVTRLAQSACERRGREIRMRSLRHDQHMDRFLAFAGRGD